MLPESEMVILDPQGEPIAPAEARLCGACDVWDHVDGGRECDGCARWTHDDCLQACDSMNSHDICEACADGKCRACGEENEMLGEREYVRGLR